MITPANRSTVSIMTFAAAALFAMLALGACASGPAQASWDDDAVSFERPLAFRFDNQAETYVDVYLITQQHQWRLARVLPGARALLRIPNSALPSITGFVQLAVIAGAPYSLDAAKDPHATLTVLQPTSELLAQRWTFSHTPLASPEILGAPAYARRN